MYDVVKGKIREQEDNQQAFAGAVLFVKAVRE
jgi:hypothetical protein